jgi:hypothetical protein
VVGRDIGSFEMVNGAGSGCSMYGGGSGVNFPPLARALVERIHIERSTWRADLPRSR